MAIAAEQEMSDFVCHGPAQQLRGVGAGGVRHSADAVREYGGQHAGAGFDVDEGEAQGRRQAAVRRAGWDDPHDQLIPPWWLPAGDRVGPGRQGAFEPGHLDARALQDGAGGAVRHAARVELARGDRAAAIAAYRRLAAVGPEKGSSAALEPRHVLALARLLHQQGDTAAARAEYERFLELWAGADEDLPELEEARRAVARLAAS